MPRPAHVQRACMQDTPRHTPIIAEMSTEETQLTGSTHANRNYRAVEPVIEEELDDGFSVVHSVVEV